MPKFKENSQVWVINIGTDNVPYLDHGTVDHISYNQYHRKHEYHVYCSKDWKYHYHCSGVFKYQNQAERQLKSRLTRMINDCKKRLQMLELQKRIVEFYS